MSRFQKTIVISGSQSVSIDSEGDAPFRFMFCWSRGDRTMDNEQALTRGLVFRSDGRISNLCKIIFLTVAQFELDVHNNTHIQ